MSLIDYNMDLQSLFCVLYQVGYFEYLAGNSDQENTITTYYTEGTPFETSLESLESYMEFDNNDKECENTDSDLYLPDVLEDFDDKCDDERLEGIINVTPSQSPVDLLERDRDGKIVSFGSTDHYSQHTPLMFSRCSSLGSLSGYEQQLLHDDRSSVISDFSRRTSEVVSPSELPDSPAQLIPPGMIYQKDKKPGRRKTQRDKFQSSDLLSVQQEPLKNSIFEDGLSVFKEESTPVKFQSVAASSLSSLTIDDDEIIDDHSDLKNKSGVINDRFRNIVDGEEKKVTNNVEPFEETYFSVDEEQILDEYIRKGIAKVTRQHFNDVPSFNFQNKSAYESNDSDPEKSCGSACKTNNSLELFDESSDLTAEEENLLDECIKRGIAKVTRQNIADVTSFGLRSKFSKLSTHSSESNKQT